MNDVETLLRMTIRVEHDVFVVRQRGREVAAALGMERQDQVRVATALSEVGRELLRDDGGTAVTFQVRMEPPALAILLATNGSVGSDGIAAAARLMDAVERTVEGIVLTRRLSRVFDSERVSRVRAELAASRPTSAVDELSVQNQQLIAALEDVQAHRDELLRLNEELQETNRGVMALYGQLSDELEQTNQGVVALYAELDERSAQLREASEAKTRFLANVSHELRAPVTAVIGLTRLLLDARSDPLTDEQTHQLQLVQTSAADLLDRVNDLLDLAKAESNQIEPQWAPVDLGTLFGQLRGTLRPFVKPGVELVVPDTTATLFSDEVLLTQILRNLLTNALKFTVEGEVRLSATTYGKRIDFVVADTGIGIPPDEQSRVFEEFHQVRGAQQVGGSGTGLGLPYARRLIALLGGELTMRSTPGVGSAFTVSLPVDHVADTAPVPGLPRLGTALVVDADSAFRQRIRELLGGQVDVVVEAADYRAAFEIAGRDRPDAIFLGPNASDGARLLDLLAADEEVRGCPVVVITDGDRPALSHATVTVERSEINARVISTVLRAIAAVE
jgi:signal transduction histidine kinase/CheY-like chemotaxis protein